MTAAKRPDEPQHRPEFIELPSLALKFEGTPTRYTPPVCDHQTPPWGPLLDMYPSKTLGPIQAKPCGHEDSFHRPSGMDTSGAGYFGLRRNKAAAFVWVRPAKIRFTEGVLATSTLEAMAACESLGLSLWAEGSKSYAWGVDGRQRAHLVKIDREKHTAVHHCEIGKLDSDPDGEGWDVRPHNHRYDPVKQTPREGSRELCDESILGVASWSIDGLADTLFDNPEPVTSDLGMTGHCLSGNHHRCSHRPGGPCHGGITQFDGSVYRCPCPCHHEEEPMARDLAKTPVSMGGLTAAEKRIAKAAREKREAERQAEYARRDAEIEAKVRADAEVETHEEWMARMKAQGGLNATPKAEPKVSKPEPGMTLQAATALLHHDPDHLADIPSEHLLTLLDCEGEKPYFAKIRRELKARGTTKRAS